MELYVKEVDNKHIYNVEYVRECDSKTLAQIYGLTLVCGIDYEDLDNQYNNRQCYVSANNFVDDIQYNEIVAYPLDETITDSLKENGYEITELPIYIERKFED